MITLKSPREIDAMAKSARFWRVFMSSCVTLLNQGLTTAQVDKFVQDKIEAAGQSLLKLAIEGYKYDDMYQC